MAAKPAPTIKRPNENFVGLDGSRRPSRTHIHANTGASAMMKSELTDWYQLLGKSQPRIELRVLRSARRLSVDPACSNSDQKSAAAMKHTPSANTSVRSD